MKRTRQTHLGHLVALCILVVPSVAQSGLAPMFQGAEVYDAGSWTTSSSYRGGTGGGIAVGDLNDDDFPDLVVTHRRNENDLDGNTVAVLLHTTDSNAPTLYQPQVTYRTGTGPYSIAIADMNQDGKLDVVTGGPDSISVLLGNGSGGLAPPQTYFATTSGQEHWTLAVADVNSDGRPDVISNSIESSFVGISVLLGVGSGALGPASSYSSGSVYVEAVAVANVTGDGSLDVVAAGYPFHGVAILRGNNTGAFTYQGSPESQADRAQDVAIGDLNGDTVPDIVIPVSEATLFPGVVVLMGFAGGYINHYYPMIGWPSEIELGDLDGDGALDIVAGMHTDDESRHCATVLRNNGSGMFEPATYYPAMAGFGEMRIADVNLDGHLDLVASSTPNIVSERVHSACVLFGDGIGGFQSTLWSLEGRNFVGAAMADFNRDGKNDIAFSDANSIGMALGTGSGTFTYMAAGALSSTPNVVVTGDWNRDGKSDIAFQNGFNVDGWYGQGTGGFTPAFSIPDEELRDGSVGDMNRDGRADLVLVATASPLPLRIYTQAANGSYVANAAVTVTGSVTNIALGDWDRNGILDVVASTDIGVSLFRGVGNGTLQAEQVLTTGRMYQDVCAGDFNRDGKLDVAAVEAMAGQSGTRGITVFPGDGLGGFGAPTTMLTLEQNGSRVRSWDVNLDGAPDLIASGYADPSPVFGPAPRPGAIEVHLGNGTGGFTSRTGHALGAQGAAFIAGDVNGDDRRDVVATGTTVSASFTLVPSFTTLLATPPNQGYWIGPRTDYTMTASTNRVAIGDLNRDGILDLVASSPSNPVTVRLGAGLGTFGPPMTVATSLSARHVGLGDINRDGILDLVISRSGLGAPEGISCMLGVGNGSFGPRLDQPYVGAAEFEIADMNRDGFLDVVVGRPNVSSSGVTVFTGNGNGTFTDMGEAYVPYVYDLEVVDYDRDGLLDVVVAGGAFYILSGNVDGTLDNSLIRNVGSTNLRNACVADFNRDGFPDVALTDVSSTVRVAWGSSGFTTYAVSGMPASALDLQVGAAQLDGRQFLYMTTYDNTVVLLQPTGTGGTFAAVVTQDVGGNPDALALGDFDRDGALDVAATNSTSGMVAIFHYTKGAVTGVAVAEAPEASARLEQNYPNPFNPRTTISYETRRAEHIRIAVYDVQGRLVRTLVDGPVPVGIHTASWNGRSKSGTPVTSGVYFYRLTTESGYAESRRMVLMK